MVLVTGNTDYLFSDSTVSVLEQCPQQIGVLIAVEEMKELCISGINGIGAVS